MRTTSLILNLDALESDETIELEWVDLACSFYSASNYSTLTFGAYSLWISNLGAGFVAYSLSKIADFLILF